MAWLATHQFDGVPCMGPLREHPRTDNERVETVVIDGRTWWWLVCTTCDLTPSVREQMQAATRAAAARGP